MARAAPLPAPRRPMGLRTWATPLTIGAFILMATTGVLMFLGWNHGLTTVAHQWFSWFFLLGAGGHIVANLRPLKNHLKSRWGRASVAAFGTVLAASFFSWGLITGPQLERPIVEALVDAPLSALALTTHTTPEALLFKMKAHGVTATSEQTIRKIAVAQNINANRLLAIAFLPDNAPRTAP